MRFMPHHYNEPLYLVEKMSDGSFVRVEEPVFQAVKDPGDRLTWTISVDGIQEPHFELTTGAYVDVRNVIHLVREMREVREALDSPLFRHFKLLLQEIGTFF